MTAPPAVDTIFALASPPGRGGVAVVRVSGADAHDSLVRLSGRDHFTPRVMMHVVLCAPETGLQIDHGLAVFFKAPRSYTGEDIAEYHIHGGAATIRHLLLSLGTMPGHRLAAPGEFTRRAFENGKLDLTAAEAVADLIDAQTLLQKSQALGQLGGGLSALYEDWATTLTQCLAHLEAALEFPDEDLPEGILPQVLPRLDGIAGAIAAHLDDNRRGERLRDGIHVAVIGVPNAGKSSLVNLLAQREVSIVSPHAGTTRDVVEVALDLGGYPVVLSDTAGLRPEQLSGAAQDQIEAEGIRRALALARQADLKLLLFDAGALPALDPHSLALIDGETLVVFNKCELYDGPYPDFDACRISVANETGIEEMTVQMIARFDRLAGAGTQPSLTRARHRTALEQALGCLRRVPQAVLPELATEDVRLAVRHLGSITGRIDIEDVLDVVFRDFCIGK